MQSSKKVHLLLLLLLLLLTLNFFPVSIAKQNPLSFCGKIRIQPPFFLQNSTESSLLNRMVVCKSQKLYFRTSLGLFQISSIDYTTKLLTISHSSCSSSSYFVSPSVLSAGFTSPPHPNSLALFHCSSHTNNHMYQVKLNCTAGLHGCKQKFDKVSSCLIVDDIEKLDKGFHPNDLNCSRYSRVYRNSSVDDDIDKNLLEGYELGTRISFEVPNHVPNVCDECDKPHGNCGIGLRCICHPKECKDKVISSSVTVNPFGNILFSLLSSIVVIVMVRSL